MTTTLGEKLEHIRTLHEVTGRCRKCSIGNVATKPLVMRGLCDAKVLIVLDKVNLVDDDYGIPNAGVDSIKMNFIASKMKITLGDGSGTHGAVTTLVGHCPKYSYDVRSPSMAEVKACHWRMNTLLNILQPHAVVCMGEMAASVFVREPLKRLWPAYYDGVIIRKIPSLDTYIAHDLDRISLTASWMPHFSLWGEIGAIVAKAVSSELPQVEWSLGTRYAKFGS